MKNKYKNVDTPDLPLPRSLRPQPLKASKAGNVLCHVRKELLAELNELAETGVLRRAGYSGDWNIMAGKFLEVGVLAALAELKKSDEAEASRAALGEIITWHKRQPPRL
jgi:hypothetical protein